MINKFCKTYLSASPIYWDTSYRLWDTSRICNTVIINLTKNNSFCDSFHFILIFSCWECRAPAGNKWNILFSMSALSNCWQRNARWSRWAMKIRFILLAICPHRCSALSVKKGVKSPVSCAVRNLGLILPFAKTNVSNNSINLGPNMQEKSIRSIRPSIA